MMQIEVFSSFALYQLQEQVNKWLEEHKGTIVIESTHFTANTEDSDGDYGRVPSTRFSAAIYYRG